MLIKFNTKINQNSEQYYHFIFCLDESGSMSCKDSNNNKSRWELLMEAF